MTYLLQTKFHRPRRRPNSVERNRLLDILNTGLWKKVSLVTGPAGSGKSTLLSDWIENVDVPSSWLSLEHEDDDPRRFLNYLVAAIRRIAPHVGQGIEALSTSTSDLNLIAALEMLILIPLSKEPVQMILIIDDLYQVKSTEIYDGLDYLIQHLPDGVHIAIATRSTPDISLPKLRVHGDLNEVRDLDLRFTQNEAQAFYNTTMGLNLSQEQVVSIEELTEGWVAAIQMVAMKLQSGIDPDSFAASLHNYEGLVSDYLLDEVFKYQSPKTIEFLMTISVLDRMCDPLCQALCGTETSGISLTELEKRNLFLISLDDNHYWYRFHHLFRDFLRGRLSDRSCERAGYLYKKSSIWFAEQNLYPEAVEHARLSGDQQLLADILCNSCLQFLFDGDFKTLDRWLSALEDSYIEQNLLLSSASAICKVCIDERLSVDSHVRRVQRCIDSGKDIGDNPFRENVRFVPVLLRALAATRRNDIDTILQIAEETLGSIPDLSREDELNRLLFSLLYGLISNNYFEIGDYDKALETLKPAEPFIDKSIGFVIWINGLNCQCHCLLIKGELNRVGDICYRALRESERLEKSLTGPVGMIFGVLGYMCLLRADWDNAQREFDRSIKRARLNSENWLLYQAHYCIAAIKLCLGDLNEASIELDYAIDDAKTLEDASRISVIKAYQALANLAAGNLKAVKRWLAYQAPFRWSIAPAEEEHNLIRAWIAIRIGKHEEAREIVNAYLMCSEEHGRFGPPTAYLYTIAWQTLKAALFTSIGLSEQAVVVLEEAIQLAMPQGIKYYFHLFADKLVPLVNGISNVEAHNFIFPIIEHAVASRNIIKETPQTVLEQGYIDPDLSKNIASLTARELQVLKSITRGTSNKQIAEELSLSEGTVKVHSHNIFTKLGVKNRTQAAAFIRGRSRKESR